MQTFKDKSGRGWTVEANVAAYQKINAVVGLNLFHLIAEDRVILNELSSPLTMYAVALVLTAAEREKQGVSDEDFGAAFDSAELSEAMGMAIVQECLRFSQGRTSGVLSKALSTAAKILSDERLKATKAMQEVVDHPDFEQTMRAQMFPADPPAESSIPSKSATSAPVNAESIPRRTRSAS